MKGSRLGLPHAVQASRAPYQQEQQTVSGLYRQQNNRQALQSLLTDAADTVWQDVPVGSQMGSRSCRAMVLNQASVVPKPCLPGGSHAVSAA